ncbi:hypothetical protein JCM24511_08781 [Saitozyma sp. JCM 24511]|nr:hypothetical protein JCM24511_08781 [Saitozyma sp. JCM 24511]
MSSTVASSTASAAAASSSAAGLVNTSSNSSFKIVGICLAIGSGLFIGTSFVVKKKGLLRATQKHGNQAGEGHAYLKSWLWWAGMVTMIVGEILNFVAYAFTEAILVTPMGALSVVVAAILSHFLLKETLTFFGWIGCTLCIMGATILALNAPEQQSVTTIAAFEKMFLAPGFLVWGSLCIAASLVTVFYVAPRWGKKNMMPYIGICSLIGGISVSCTQGLGSSIVTSIQGNNQVKNWFFWFLFVFVVVTLLVEINYLNKALELFNTSMVVPVYFCFFTSATLVTSFILYQGLKASAVSLITMVLGFLIICLGITLLQMSKVDPKQLSKLDRRSTMLLEAGRHGTEAEEKGDVTAMEDPGMDALRGGFGAVGSIIRARSVSRRLSSASSYQGGKRWPYDASGNLSTHGLGNLQRFQLSDAPMPADAMDQISLHSAKSPAGASGGGLQYGHPLESRPSKSHLKFEEADVVHQYGYGRHDEPVHSSRQHIPHPMFPPSRQGSNNSIQPVYEEPEEEARAAISRYSVAPDEQPHVSSAPSEKTSYPDPYRLPSPSPQSARPALGPSHRGFSGLFHFGTNPDLTLKHEGDRDRDMTRGGAHRGTKDYPYLKDRDAAVEHEERAGLVGRQDDDDDGARSDGASEGGEEEPGEVQTAERRNQGVRRLPEIPRV